MNLNAIFTAIALTVASPPILSAGPTGWGDLKIGISREEVYRLKSNNGVYLSEPLKPSKARPSSSTSVDENKYVTRVNTPFGGPGVVAHLGFINDRLSSIEFSLDDRPDILQEISSQIQAKYGSPLDKSDQKQISCRLADGSSIPWASGHHLHEWVEVLQDGGQIATRVYDVSIGCPSDPGAVVHKGFGIRLESRKSNNRIDNKF